ncbi:MAG: hypothetical protein PHC48_10380 [Prevotella sp.]|nr:hypothetical protein [Prevotella sp.]
MTQKQLKYVLTLLATFPDSVTVRTYMLIRFNGIQVLSRDRWGWKCYIRERWWGRKRFFTIKPWQIESMLSQLDYVDTYEDMGVRLEDIHGLRAVDVLLHGVRFLDYLNAEKYYQAYNIKQEDRYLMSLIRILYSPRKRWWHKVLHMDQQKHIKASNAEMLGAYLWFSYVKTQLSQAFPHFFRKLAPEDAGDFDMRRAIDAQVRALTDGDVTKEQRIFDTDCWRALTELDNKAREAEEWERKLKH